MQAWYENNFLKAATMADSNPKDRQEITFSSVPKAVISRLSLYLRELQQLLGEGKQTVRSGELGNRLGFTDAQVRKDLTYFGQFGYPGIGYRSEELVQAIRHRTFEATARYNIQIWPRFETVESRPSHHERGAWAAARVILLGIVATKIG